jgi:AcrR family transcriptional regulator
MDDKGGPLVEPDSVILPLRARKQRRTREAIVDAAMHLFAARGFDGVTVADIAHRAEVGRSTFFRYFADKQEVLFADDAGLQQLLVDVSEQRAAALAPLGDSLADALVVARAGVMAMTRRIAEYPGWLPVRERLIEENPELSARNLIKHRGYVTAGVEVLLRHGAARNTAMLATSLAAACFAAGHARALDGELDLTTAVDEAFGQLCTLDGPALRRLLYGPTEDRRADAR